MTCRWRAWYGDDALSLEFPSGWDVSLHEPADAREIGDEEIERALDRPIGALRLEEIARGKSTAAIAVEDISRPCPAARLLPKIVTRLEAGGIRRGSIRIVMSIGSHRAMTRQDIVKKLGRETADAIDVINHYPHANLVDLGRTRRGTPVLINRIYAEADVKIGVGSLLPHGGPGLGGGAKIVVPGVAGLETILSIHRPGRLRGGVNLIEGNELRDEVEEIAREHLRLDWIVNAVLTSSRGIAAVFAGDLVAAHRAGVEVARRVYATPMPEQPLDAVVCNAYPKDTEFVQSGNALNVLRSWPQPLLKPEASTVIVTASPEGRGYHLVFGPGMPYHQSAPEERTIVFSPDLSSADTGVANTFRTWDSVIACLAARHGSRPRVAVFPCASMQLGTG